MIGTYVVTVKSEPLKLSLVVDAARKRFLGKPITETIRSDINIFIKNYVHQWASQEWLIVGVHRIG